jgi:parvulin-like peptidyl-prolyl isomerase
MINTTFRRVICALLAIVCILSFTACNKKITDNEVNGENLDIKNEDVVLIIDGNPVDYEEYRYFYLNTKHDMDGGDESFWSKNPEKEAELKDKALTTLSIFYALYNLANEYEVAVSEEVRANIDASVQSTLDSEQKEDFLSFLESIHTNVDYYKKICEFSYLEYDLYEKLSAEGVIAATTEEVTDLLMGDDYVRVMHILYADEAKAKEILPTAKEATDEEFYALAQDAEDQGMIGNTDGYYFTYGVMTPEFEEASFALKDGETSDLVYGSYGYHIIRRLPKSVDYIEANAASFSGDIVQRKYIDFVENKADELKENAKFEAVYERITATNAK